MPYAIYALINPIDGQSVHYVGMTEDIRRRFVEHLRSGADWIESLLAQGLIPICRTLEIQYDKAIANAREIYWTDFYRKQGMPLANAMKITKKVVYEKDEELPPLDKDELKREIVRLHVEEQVPRGEILKQKRVSTAKSR